MQKIWKYELIISSLLDEGSDIDLPIGAKILKTTMQEGECYMWALVDPTMETEERTFIIMATGEVIEFPGCEAEYIDTFRRGKYIWHLFEVRYGGE